MSPEFLRIQNDLKKKKVNLLSTEGTFSFFLFFWKYLADSRRRGENKIERDRKLGGVGGQSGGDGSVCVCVCVCVWGLCERQREVADGS